jgi:hypothetical protein
MKVEFAWKSGSQYLAGVLQGTFVVFTCVCLEKTPANTHMAKA